MIKPLVNNFDPSSNFWEINSHLKNLGVFKEIYVKDKSKDKRVTSTLMWFVAFIEDMSSPLCNLNYSDRVDEVCKNVIEESTSYINDNQINIKKCSDYYRELQDTPAIKQLRVWNKKMQEKTKYMESVVYDKSTYEMLEKMMGSNVGLYKNLQQITEQVLKTDQSEGKAEGGKELTLTDKGLI